MFYFQRIMIIYFPNHEIQRNTSWNDVLWRQRERSRNSPRECITVCLWLIFMNWILVMTVSLGFTKLLTDCTGSKWCETLQKRTPVTHSSGKLTGGARTKPCKTTAFYFVLESNSGRFSNEKRAVEELKNDHLKKHSASSTSDDGQETMSCHLV